MRKIFASKDQADQRIKYLCKIKESVLDRIKQNYEISEPEESKVNISSSM